MQQLLEIMPWIWGTIVLITIVIELFSTDVDAIWFSIGAAFSLFLSLFKFNIILQLSTFIIFTSCLLFTVGKLVKKMIAKKDIKKTIDSLIGKEIFVIENADEFNKGSGVINDIVWTLTCETNNYVEKGQHAIISGIKGNKLIVTSKSK